jgi:hypothetical protein
VRDASKEDVQQATKPTVVVALVVNSQQAYHTD